MGVHAIRGLPTEAGYLTVAAFSTVRIRAPLTQLDHLLVLSGKRLEIAGYPIRLGVAQLHPLKPDASLRSELVTIKGYLEASDMEKGVRKQLDTQAVSTSVNVQIGRRRVLKVKQQVIVGFQVRLAGLSDEESLRIQHDGIGGRRHLGCGLFTTTQQAEDQR